MCRRAKITYGAVVVSIICTCAVYHLHVLIKDFHFGLLFQFFWRIWDCGVRSTATTKIHDITTKPRIPHSFGYHEIAPAFSTSSKFFLLFLTLDSFLVDPRLLFFGEESFLTSFSCFFFVALVGFLKKTPIGRRDCFAGAIGREQLLKDLSMGYCVSYDWHRVNSKHIWSCRATRAGR